MNTKLEQYVEQVGVRLRTLPPDERARQTDELRQHLDALTAARRELGESDIEAAENAVRQFGAAEDVGGRLVRAHRRAQVRRALNQPVLALALQVRSLLDRPAIAVALLTAAFAAGMPLMWALHIPDLWYQLGMELPTDEPSWQNVLFLGTEPTVWLCGVAIGLTLAMLAPRSGHKSVRLAYLATMVGYFFWAKLYRTDAWRYHPLFAFVNFIEIAAVYAAMAAGAAAALHVSGKLAGKRQSGSLIGAKGQAS